MVRQHCSYLTILLVGVCYRRVRLLDRMEVLEVRRDRRPWTRLRRRHHYELLAKLDYRGLLGSSGLLACLPVPRMRLVRQVQRLPGSIRVMGAVVREVE